MMSWAKTGFGTWKLMKLNWEDEDQKIERESGVKDGYDKSSREIKEI